MRKFQAAELRDFLSQLDRHLTDAVELLVVGGGAAALHYGVSTATADIDVYEGDVAALEAALRAVRAETGLAIPIARAGVAELPLHHRDRVVNALPKLRKLRVLVPERHDLVLSKLMRGAEIDLQVIETLHRLKPLDLDLLLDRYLTEMRYAIGPQADHDLNLLAALERLAGTEYAQAVSTTLAARRRR